MFKLNEKKERESMDKELLTAKDLHKLYGLTPRFWHERRRLGNGPRYIKISHCCVRYRRGDVEKWLNSLEK